MEQSALIKYAGNALYRQITNEAKPEVAEAGLVRTPNACFVAGTLVHTREGMVPIEKIRVGDWVLSQPEGGGEQAYKRVLNTLVFDDKEVYSVDFATKELICTVVATDNHPFWVENVGWTRADMLWPEGDHQLRLSDGTVCGIFHCSQVYRTEAPHVGWILGGFGPCDSDGLGRTIDLRDGRVSIDYAYQNLVRNPLFDDGSFELLRVRVYNLEVDDFHTYYVGELGAWVHNTTCERVQQANLPTQSRGKAIAPRRPACAAKRRDQGPSG